ncbi:hypothetical protein [Pelagimonas varians]|uniref:Uncharacterized protein n=1 Tax=Pelagimonas varians TaxID=696760 RepID=A0A238JYF4_9RHOB|nr:hypothetical protein [Pelagimonas varians]PYG33104.1 hypothetical protein C8N36_10299 [Pelagimonas varians]SMX35690.1 hypothetical protein PEV8663_00561 [Pelagimonas varians]
MTLRVIVSQSGLSATVSGQYHATQIVGLDDAVAWVRFYERMAKGKTGRFYGAKLDAFRQALQGMKAAQAGGRA